jgi:hypothetical protein|tara:strand:+ start:385 stop:651 length:267 start_codon:yes stop_codon:yes gene_type:complete
MKTIVETSSNLSKYLLADDVDITATATEITVGDPAQFIIADLNSTTVTITDNVTNAPEDWTGNKYFFDGTTWTANPDWVDPDAEEGGE